MITSPIYDPAHAGDVESVRQWLQKNPDDLNSPISDGYALLHIACMFGHEPLTAFLLERGALVNLNASNDSHALPLHLATMFRDEQVAKKLIKLLLGNGAELNGIQTGGQTALHHAVARGSALLVETLILGGADPFFKDEKGRAPTDLAKELKDADVAATLQQVLKKAHGLVQEARI